MSFTPLMAAAQNDHPETVQALIDRGANINQGTTDNGVTALNDYACAVQRKPEFESTLSTGITTVCLTQNELTQQNHHGRSAIVILSERRDISIPLLQLFLDFAVPKSPPYRELHTESDVRNARLVLIEIKILRFSVDTKPVLNVA